MAGTAGNATPDQDVFQGQSDTQVAGNNNAGTNNNGMPYTTVKDLNFNRPDAGPANTANSTAIGDDWTDHTGIFAIRNTKLTNITPGGQSGVHDVLYRPESENLTEGRMLIYGIGGPSLFYDPATESGYGGFFYNDGILFHAGVNGVTAQSGYYASGTPISSTTVSEWTWKQITNSGTTSTQITVRFFDASDLATPLGNTIVYNDSTAALQNVSGRIGICIFQGVSVSRVIIQNNVSGPITTPPVLSVDTKFRTFINFKVATAEGGVGPITYQVQRSIDNEITWTDCPGATGVTPQAAALVAGNTSKYRSKATDGTNTAYSAAITVQTVKSRENGGRIFSFVGTSITFGVDGGAYPGRLRAIDRLRELGLSCEGINEGHSGNDTGQILADLNAIITRAQAVDADTISFCSNTNDIGHTSAYSHTVQGYKDTVIQFCQQALANGTGIRNIVLHDDVGIGTGTQQDYELAVAMNAALDDIAANNNFGGKVLRGDKTILGIAHTSNEFLGYIHPTPAGQYILGTVWANALYSLFGSTNGTSLNFVINDNGVPVVTYTSPTSGVTFHYSVNGSAYTTGASVNLTTPGTYTVNVYATKPGMSDSQVVTTVYTVLATPVVGAILLQVSVSVRVGL